MRVVMFRVARRVVPCAVAACAIACSPASPTTSAPRYDSWQQAVGEVSAVNTNGNAFSVQNGAITGSDVHVTARTRFTGVADFGALVAAYRLGYRLRVSVNSGCGGSAGVSCEAVDVSLDDKRGPFPVHYQLGGISNNTWVGVPVVQGGNKTSVVMLPWTTVRQDSEFASVADIIAAVDAHQSICVAGEGFTVAERSTHATTIGAWRYSGDSWTACRER